MKANQLFQLLHLHIGVNEVAPLIPTECNPSGTVLSNSSSLFKNKYVD